MVLDAKKLEIKYSFLSSLLVDSEPPSLSEKSTELCSCCQKSPQRYSCSHCNAPICSQDCFQRHNNQQCYLSFCKTQVTDHMQSQRVGGVGGSLEEAAKVKEFSGFVGSYGLGHQEKKAIEPSPVEKLTAPTTPNSLLELSSEIHVISEGPMMKARRSEREAESLLESVGILESLEAEELEIRDFPLGSAPVPEDPRNPHHHQIPQALLRRISGYQDQDLSGDRRMWWEESLVSGIDENPVAIPPLSDEIDGGFVICRDSVAPRLPSSGAEVVLFVVGYCRALRALGSEIPVVWGGEETEAATNLPAQATLTWDLTTHILPFHGQIISGGSGGSRTPWVARMVKERSEGWRLGSAAQRRDTKMAPNPRAREGTTFSSSSLHHVLSKEDSTISAILNCALNGLSKEEKVQVLADAGCVLADKLKVLRALGHTELTFSLAATTSHLLGPSLKQPSARHQKSAQRVFKGLTKRAHGFLRLVGTLPRPLIAAGVPMVELASKIAIAFP